MEDSGLAARGRVFLGNLMYQVKSWLLQRGADSSRILKEVLFVGKRQNRKK